MNSVKILISGLLTLGFLLSGPAARSEGQETKSSDQTKQTAQPPVQEKQSTEKTQDKKPQQPPKSLDTKQNGKATQESKDEQKKVLQPLLWKIQHSDNPDIESYLFATTHSRDPSVLKLHPEVIKAVAKSQTIYMELIPQDSARQIDGLKMGRFHKLEKRVPAELIKELDAALKKINPDFTRQSFPKFRVWAWALVLPSLHRKEKAPKSTVQDYVLEKLAVSSGKKMASLEIAKQQLVTMNYLTKEEQANLLRNSIMEFDDEKKEGKFLKLYLAGEPNELGDFIMKDYEPKKFLDEKTQAKIKNFLITVRNRNMGKKIVRTISNQPKQVHFFSLAASHLVGNNGLAQALQNNGFTITLIRDGKPNVALQKADPKKKATTDANAGVKTEKKPAGSTESNAEKPAKEKTGGKPGEKSSEKTGKN